MAKLTDMPPEILNIICSMLLEVDKNVTIEHAFAQGNSWYKSSTDHQIGKFLTKASGLPDVFNFARTSRHFQSLANYPWHLRSRILSFHGSDFLPRAIKFLRSLSSHPNGAQQVQILYLNLEESTSSHHSISPADINFLHEQSGAVVRTSGERLRNVARAVLGKLPNLEQLGMTLETSPYQPLWKDLAADGTWIPFYKDPWSSQDDESFELAHLHQNIQYLGLRFNHQWHRPVGPGYFATKRQEVFEILFDLEVRPTHLYVDDLTTALCGFHRVSGTAGMDMLFKNITHLTIAGASDSQRGQSSRLADTDIDLSPFRVYQFLLARHRTSLRKLCLDFSFYKFNLGGVGTGFLASFTNLHTLWIDTRSIVPNTPGTPSPRAFDKLPASLRHVCFSLDGKGIGPGLQWLAENRATRYPKLHVIQFKYPFFGTQQPQHPFIGSQYFDRQYFQYPFSARRFPHARMILDDHRELGFEDAQVTEVENAVLWTPCEGPCREEDGAGQEEDD
ncbi:hypothetical protein Cob_v006321 [Colletotrichum orbiculare MAFF 240422]|uniref:Uncharacterized protein n=1 Tax=Colletotrichum orbiculare (strain 104-T / ATCC 96160 / CBS 514.97 / LARS 414 / MAFF 240422) TaxID=1213857 RepID=A0A484FT03_COLOR|nr:hypothetical protein Cob_v006321 [Colletotrichum orbiculare MAFF 240422]